MQSILQILKLNEPKTGISTKNQKPYDMQDAECLLLNDDGSVGHVGVLQVPRTLRDKVTIGTFACTFALGVNFASRRVEAQLVDIVPFPSGKNTPPTAAPASSKA